MNSNIEWLDWGRPAFDKSVKDGKPILLSITVPWSSYCREMSDLTYSREEVIEKVNQGFIPVRVNGEERPDVNLRYGQGGWPSTVFLTPRGSVITGCTYVPEAQFTELLEQVVGIYEALNRSGRTALGPENTDSMAGFEEKRLYYIKNRTPFIDRFQELLFSSFDQVYGGFGFHPRENGPKYPLPYALGYLLKRYELDGESKVKVVIEKTLESMVESGLFDFLEGGFFHYSLDRKWQFPCSEKLLVDNIELAQIYYDAARILGDARFQDIYEKTVRFVNQWLLNPETKEFYSSVSADANYYKLASRAERLAYLKGHKSPLVDRAVYTNVGAVAANFYLERKIKEYSNADLNRLLVSMRSPDGLFFHCGIGGTGCLNDFFTDQVNFTRLLVSCSQLPSEPAVGLSRSELVADLWNKTMNTFYDRVNGGFIDRRKVDNEVGLAVFPRKVLKDNVVAVSVLKHFGQKEEARQTLIELLWKNKTPNLYSGSLAAALLTEF